MVRGLVVGRHVADGADGFTLGGAGVPEERLEEEEMLEAIRSVCARGLVSNVNGLDVDLIWRL